MPKKMMMLCKPCADKLGANATVRVVRKEANMKITCRMCNRRRYGAEYEVGGKDEKGGVDDDGSE